MGRILGLYDSGSCVLFSRGFPHMCPVLVKIFDLGTLRYTHPEDFERGFYDSEMASSAMENEMALLTGPLAPLQGSVIPAMYGKWVGEFVDPRFNTLREYHVVVMQLAGAAACGDCLHASEDEEEDLRLVSPQVKHNVVLAYKALHATGVVHRNVQPRYALVDQTNESVKLIDFEASVYMGDGADRLAENVRDAWDRSRNMVRSWLAVTVCSVGFYYDVRRYHDFATKDMSFFA